MKLNEIKAAVDAGKTVCWSNSGYRVIKDSKGQYLIKCLMNNSMIGLTWMDGVTLNGEEKDFYVLPVLFDFTNDFDSDEEAMAWAAGFCFGEAETSVRDYPKYKREVDEVNGVKVWYDFGADYYFYEDISNAF